MKKFLLLASFIIVGCGAEQKAKTETPAIPRYELRGDDVNNGGFYRSYYNWKPRLKPRTDNLPPSVPLLNPNGFC